MTTDRWRQIIGHDGYFVVRLHLFDVAEGGQNRHVQSGFRAGWIVEGTDWSLPGPIDLVGPQRSLAPGAEALVHVHPMQPEAWIDVRPGTNLTLTRNQPRPLGSATVLVRVRVPKKPVPLRLSVDPGRVAHAAVLRRRPTPVELLQDLLRRWMR